jgi:hypothetical protein
MRDHSPRMCLCCKEIFIPNPHAPQAKYCSQPACRKASKQASQAQWLNKPENRNYFCGPQQVERVRQWRREHPGYWRRNKGRKARPLQDSVALQDLVRSPTGAAFIGFLAGQTGGGLQETVATTFWNMHSRGQAIIGMKSVLATKGAAYASVKTRVVSGTAAAG